MSTKRKRVSRAREEEAAAAPDIFDVPDLDEEVDNDEVTAVLNATPTKPAALRNGTVAADAASNPAVVSTPRSSMKRAAARELTTPKSTRRTLPLHLSKQNPVTPSKFDTPRRNAADRSAKRKSSRRILEKAIAAEASEDEGGEDDIAEKIVGGRADSPDAGSGGEDEEDEDGDGDGAVGETEERDAQKATPAKRGRGRPKGSKNREITPPKELPAHEWYFWINRPNSNKTSSNTFPASALLNHADYHSIIQAYEDPHAASITNLHQHHAGEFPLWDFELSQGFSVLLYGYGDKLPLLTAWADWLHEKYEREHGHEESTSGQRAKPKSTPSKGRRKGKNALAGSGVGTTENGVENSVENSNEAANTSTTRPVTIVLDAHHQALVPRSLFETIANGVLPPEKASSLPNQPADACNFLLSQLNSLSADSENTSAPIPHIYLLVTAIHAPLLAHAPMPSLLASLASHPQVHLIAGVDDPLAPLLWPQALRDAYRWVFHDATTFRSYDRGDGQVSGGAQGVVDAVDDLLGRSGTRAKGREGVRWVLRSLPENARAVYRILVMEILSAADGGDEVDLLDFGSHGGNPIDSLAMDIDTDFGFTDVIPTAEDDDDEDDDNDNEGVSDAMDVDGLLSSRPSKDKDKDKGPGKRGRPRKDKSGGAKGTASSTAIKNTNKARPSGASGPSSALPTIPYRSIYAKAVEEFLCSSEMAFRGLLKEFVDHQMVSVKRDLAGQEVLAIELRRDELEGVLEDLTLGE